MLLSATAHGKTLFFRNPSKPNIYAIDSASAVIGGPVSGKTSFLNAIVDSILKRDGSVCKVDLNFSGGHSFNENEWGVVYRSSCRYAEPIPEHENLSGQCCVQFNVQDAFKDHQALLNNFGIDLSAHLSGSEKDLLDLFASIRTSIAEMCGKPNLLIVLDNPDAGWHPVWQRRLVQNLTSFLAECKVIYNILNIQLVISTNSPLVIGDFPSEYLCKLTPKYWNGGDASSEDAPEDEGSFATYLQHMYNVVMDTPTLGEFATRTINTTIANLRAGNCSELDDYVISQVGDQVVYRELVRIKNGIK
ncbi:MAG: hypothetical protein RSD49_21655 [Hafnia sp.]